ncbi:hypothetical protein ACFL2H_13160 [Planctomycetota bacterium]
MSPFVGSIFDPLFPVVKVLPRDRIIAEQKAPPHNAIHDMHNRNFIRSKNIRTSQPSHHPTLHQNLKTEPSEFEPES